VTDVVPDDGLLTTVGNVKNYLGITAATDDALLQRLVNAASAWIKQFLNRDIVSRTYSEIRDGTGGNTLVLANYPVTAVALLQLGAPNVAKHTLVEGTDFVVGPDGLIRVFTCALPRGMANITINYTAGFVQVPADIEQATVALVAWRYKEKERIGQSSKTLGGHETVAFQTKDVPEDVKTSLANWKKVTLV